MRWTQRAFCIVCGVGGSFKDTAIWKAVEGTPKRKQKNERSQIVKKKKKDRSGGVGKKEPNNRNAHPTLKYTVLWLAVIHPCRNSGFAGGITDGVMETAGEPIACGRQPPTPKCCAGTLEMVIRTKIQ